MSAPPVQLAIVSPQELREIKRKFPLNCLNYQINSLKITERN